MVDLKESTDHNRAVNCYAVDAAMLSGQNAECIGSDRGKLCISHTIVESACGRTVKRGITLGLHTRIAGGSQFHNLES